MERVPPDLQVIQVYTVRQVAVIIQRHPSFVSSEIRAGNLKAKKTGVRYRIRKEWVEQYLEQTTPTARPMAVEAKLTLQASLSTSTSTLN
jgi:excisionase family DNA binding protein